MNPLEASARAFAEHHHHAIGQKRKFTGEPYIVHPAAVVALVRAVPHTPAMLAAAWLHDTVEDTKATLEDIESAFGTEVATLVRMLTKRSRHADGDRQVRKALDMAHYAEASAAAQTIKLADVIDNIRTVAVHDPDFASIYLAEKAELVDELRAGDPSLRQLARRTLRAAIACLARQGVVVHADEPSSTDSSRDRDVDGEASDAAKTKPRPWEKPLSSGEFAFTSCARDASAHLQRRRDALDVLRQQFPDPGKQAAVDWATSLSALIAGGYAITAWDTHPMRAAVSAGMAAGLAFVILRRELAWRYALAAIAFGARPTIRWLFPSKQPVVQRIELREWHLVVWYPEGVIGVRWEDVTNLSLGFHRGDLVVRLSIAGMLHNFDEVTFAPDSYAPIAKDLFRRNFRSDRAELLIDPSTVGISPGDLIARAKRLHEAVHRWYTEWW